MKTLNLEKLQEGWLGIPSSAGSFYYPATLACLEGNGHDPDCTLTLTGDWEEALKLNWTGKLTEKTLSFWKNKHLATEYGAIGIAAFIIEEFTDLEFLEIMEIGDGADFFLCKKTDSGIMSFRQEPAAKLEVSGIWNEKIGNTINMRINLKKRQVDKGELGFPIYIIVVEFGQLKAKCIKK